MISTEDNTHDMMYKIVLVMVYIQFSEQISLAIKSICRTFILVDTYFR